MPIFFLLLLIITFNSLAQLCMKAAALHLETHAVPIVFSIWLLATAACLGIAFLCWQTALRSKPISFLHPFCALVYVLVPALCVIFFQEIVTGKYVIGIFCIITGVCITSAGVCPPEKQCSDKSIC